MPNISSSALRIMMIGLLISGSCNAKQLTDKQSWGYGIMTGILVGFCGFIGSLIVISCTKYKGVNIQVLNKMLIAFAIGALLGDAFLHLIPIAFGAHSHDDHEEHAEVLEDHVEELDEPHEIHRFLQQDQERDLHDEDNDLDHDEHHDEHDHDVLDHDEDSDEHDEHDYDLHDEEAHEEEKADTKILSLMLCLGYFLFYLSEKFMHLFAHHKHSHLPDDDEEQQEQINQNQKETQQDEENHQQLAQDQKNGVKELNQQSSPFAESPICDTQGQNPKKKFADLEQNKDKGIQNTPLQQKINQSPTKEQLIKKQKDKVPGFLNLFSDFLHNILDGLAIGVAFAGGDSTMIMSTTIAVFAHEIPQEIGDTGILLKSGFSPLQVVILNGIVNMTALVGTIIGLAIGQTDEIIIRYMYAFIAANFIYIAASDMLPQIIEDVKGKYFFCQTFLILLGIGVMWAVLEIEEATADH